MSLNISAQRRNDVYLRDNWICWICESPVDPRATGDERASVDHVKPRIEGGSNALDNLRLAHACCNEHRARVQGLDVQARKRDGRSGPRRHRQYARL